MHLFNPFNRSNALLALAMGTALGLFATPARAGDAQCILGHWEGTLKEKDSTTGQVRINSVFLDINSLEKDSDKPPAGALRFPAPRACRLALSYSGEEANQYYLTLEEPNGGVCARMVDVQMRLECNGPAELKARYEYPGPNNTTKVEELTLSRQKPASTSKK